MKYSIQSCAMAGGKWGETLNIEDLCKYTSAIGLDAIDWLSTYNNTPEEVRQIMDDYGLVTSCYTFFADMAFPEINMESLDIFKKDIDTACILGTDTVMIPYIGKEDIPRNIQREYIIKHLEKVINYATEKNIIVTVEDFPGRNAPFLIADDIIEAHKILPDLWYTYDSGNMLTGLEDPIVNFLKTKDFVKFMHFKDFSRTEEICGPIGADNMHYRPELIGEGLVDYKTLVPLVKKYYDGYINMEYEGADYSKEEAVVKAVNYLNSL